MGTGVALFIYKTNFGLARLELKWLWMLRRSLPEMVQRVSKTKPILSSPEPALSQPWARVSDVTWARYEKGNLVCPDSSQETAWFPATNLGTRNFLFRTAPMWRCSPRLRAAQDWLSLAHPLSHFWKAAPQHPQPLQLWPTEPKIGPIHKNGYAGPRL